MHAIMVVLAIVFAIFLPFIVFAIIILGFFLALIGIAWLFKTFAQSRAIPNRETTSEHKRKGKVSPRGGKRQAQGQFRSKSQRTDSQTEKSNEKKQYGKQDHQGRREKRNGEHFGRQESRSIADNYYERLGIRPNASSEEIEAAWRGIDTGQNLSIEIRRAYFEAFRVLRDPELRRRYDRDILKERPEREKQDSKKREGSQGGEQERRRNQEQKEKRESGESGRAEQKVFQLLSENYYERLDVGKSATPAEIKSAWRRITKRWHPDICGHPDATQVIQKCNEAYDVLKDSGSRRKYDSRLDEGQATSPNGSQASSQHTPPYNHRRREDGRAQKPEYRKEQRTYHRSPRFYTGTWAKIGRGPWTGTWGAWIESLYVEKGDIALIRRRDGRECSVLIVQVLKRSQGNRVTLCRVEENKG